MMKKIKVAFFADILVREFDGASRTMFHLIDRIDNQKYDFLFITGQKPINNFPFKCVEIPNFQIPFHSRYSMAMPQLIVVRLNKLLNKFQPDVIHVASPSFLGKYAIDYAEKKEVPTLSIYHTHFISYIPYYTKNIPIATSIVQQAVITNQRKFYDRFQKVLIPTQNIIQELSSYGFHKDNMVLWQRGMAHHVFSPAKKNSRFIKNIVKNDHPNILFASRLVWEKNLALLPKIHRRLRDKGCAHNFIIVGDGAARANLEKMMPEAYFVGNVDQDKLATFYASSDIFVFPSISETYGNVVVEAMACGCPVVVANGGGSASFVTQGITGFISDPKSSQDFAEKISIILRSQLLRNQFKKAGIQYTKQLCWDTLARQYFGYIQELSEIPVLV